MDGDALELALAVYRAPDRRFALLGRPLPDDVGLVLHLATGIQPQLRERQLRGTAKIGADDFGRCTFLSTANSVSTRR